LLDFFRTLSRKHGFMESVDKRAELFCGLWQHQGTKVWGCTTAAALWNEPMPADVVAVLTRKKW
jgi:hypothetical protein